MTREFTLFIDNIPAKLDGFCDFNLCSSATGKDLLIDIDYTPIITEDLNMIRESFGGFKHLKPVKIIIKSDEPKFDFYAYVKDENGQVKYTFYFFDETLVSKNKLICNCTNRSVSLTKFKPLL